MKSIVIAIVAAVLGSTFSLAVVGHAQSSKTPSAVAFVSGTRVFSESAHGRSEGGRLRTLQQQRADEVRVKQEAFDATRRQEAAATDNAAKLELQKKEAEQRADLERATQQAQVDLATLQRQINTDLQQRVKTVLDDLLKTQSYQLVLNSDTSILWAAPELDLTTAVIARLNGQ